nr:MAG: hypothetical protein E4H34_02265 [Hyphomicrobiales bacterium]
MARSEAPQNAGSKEGRPGILCKACGKPIGLLKAVVKLDDTFEASCPHCGDISGYDQGDIILLEKPGK